MLDIVILSVPGTVSKWIPAAPAILKGSVTSAGFTCKIIDFNIRLYQDLINANDVEGYFLTGLDVDQEPTATELVHKWVKEIVGLNPKHVGISVFTHQNRIATKLFCVAIREYLPNAKIILGGQGLSDGGIQGATGFGKQMIDTKLADYWIRSEGEISLVELLKNNITYPGINSDTYRQIDDLDNVPFPVYDDYDLDLYDGGRQVPIVGSRGCVRSCSFCDIHEHWQYRYRSGEKIVDEILHLKNTYQIQNFNFTDSLINGNLKEFKKFIKLLAEYNRQHVEKITWTSQFIVRSEKIVDEQYWQDIADSGGHRLAIGVETGSDRVRHHMNKKFTNEDLDYTMRMLDKYNITCIFLMIVGYPTETDSDFDHTLDMFTQYQSLANRIIVDVGIGSTLSILPGTPLYHHADLHNIQLDDHENNWISLDNADLTLEKRLHRRELLEQHLKKLGYSDSKIDDSMIKILNKNKAMFKKRLELRKIMRIKNAS